MSWLLIHFIFLFHVLSSLQPILNILFVNEFSTFFTLKWTVHNIVKSTSTWKISEVTCKMRKYMVFKRFADDFWRCTMFDAFCMWIFSVRFWFIPDGQCWTCSLHFGFDVPSKFKTINFAACNFAENLQIVWSN